MGSLVSSERDVDQQIVWHHVKSGGCIVEFWDAMEACNPEHRAAADVDVAACVKATTDLRKCFAGNPVMFEHDYLWRVDARLDQDLSPTPQEIRKESLRLYRWWTGMRRS